MRRAELLGDLRVVARALVDIVDDDADGRAGGDTLEHPGQDARGIRLATLRDMPAATRPATVEIVLHVLFRERKTGRAAVDDAADGRAVTLAERGDGEEPSDAVS